MGDISQDISDKNIMTKMSQKMYGIKHGLNQGLLNRWTSQLDLRNTAG